jgi:uncharacterized membrane protein
MAPLSSRASPLTTFFVGAGLLCCIYLAALKLINLPCPLTGCSEIINSRFGTVLGVPLPILAIPLWVVLALNPASNWQRMAQMGCALALGIGGAVLMVIQFFVLKGFCPFCTLHAVAAFAVVFALPLKGRAHSWLPALILALALPVFQLVKTTAEAQLQSQGAVASIPPGGVSSSSPASARVPFPDNIDQAAFRWLGDIDAKQSPILVVSFQCSHCLSLLEQTLRDPQIGTLKGPKIFVYAQPQESEDSVALIAAILSVPGSPQEQFATVFGRIGDLRDPLLTHDSKELRKRLGVLFPGYADKLAAARLLFNLQVVALKFVPGKGSPYLLMPDGTSTYGVVPANLLFH